MKHIQPELVLVIMCMYKFMQVQLYIYIYIYLFLYTFLVHTPAEILEIHNVVKQDLEYS